MKTMSEALKFEFVLYFKSSRFVMPLVVLWAFLFSIYSVSPVGVVDSACVSAAFLFYLMTWIGMTYSDSKDPVTEQLMVLRLGSQVRYDTGLCLFLVAMGGLASLLMLLVPAALNLVNHFQLFDRGVSLQDAASALFLLCSSGALGGAVGSFFHPRLGRDRKAGIMATLLWALMGLGKAALLKEVPQAALITWIFPPIAEVMGLFSGMDTFIFGKVMQAILYMTGYGAVITGIKIWLLNRRKF